MTKIITGQFSLFANNDFSNLRGVRAVSLRELSFFYWTA